MFSKPANRNYHVKLIKDMQACKLAVDNGVCYGYSAMAMQAILLRDTASFDRRMSVLYERPEGELVAHMQEAFAPLSTFHSVYKMATQQFYMNMQAFLQNVSIYQNLRPYRELFNVDYPQLKQDIQRASDIILPQKLIDQGGLAKSGGFYGIYTNDELGQLLQSLYVVLQEQNTQYPVAFLIVSSNHALTIGFDPDYDGWIFMEVHSGLTKISDSEQTARNIHQAFSVNDHVAMSVTAYTVGKHAKKTQEILQEWSLGEEYRCHHAMSMWRIKSEDSHQTGLLYMTVVNNDVPRLATLLKSSHVNINQMTRSGLSALHFASIYGYTDCIKLLLQYPDINVNQGTGTNGETPLHIALTQQHLDTFRYLLQHDKTDVNVCRKDGYNALQIAACNGCLEYLNEMIKIKRLNVNQATSDGVTALHIAVQNNQIECVRALLAHPEIDINAITNKGATALMLAAAFNHIDIAKEIISAFPETVTVSIDGLNAYEVASYHNHTKMVDLLGWFMRNASVMSAKL